MLTVAPPIRLPRGRPAVELPTRAAGGGAVAPGEVRAAVRGLLELLGEGWAFVLALVLYGISSALLLVGAVWSGTRSRTSPPGAGPPSSRWRSRSSASRRLASGSSSAWWPRG